MSRQLKPRACRIVGVGVGVGVHCFSPQLGTGAPEGNAQARYEKREENLDPFAQQAPPHGIHHHLSMMIQ